MPPPYTEKWERTKRYLNRKFVMNPVSPIPEEERSSPDSGSLPDLIVEPEPDRHDHPPSFYEGLEQRMKEYHRQLFLGVNDSEDDSSDFEVNRSMASTFILDSDTSKDNVIRNDTNIDSALGVSITKEKQLTKSTTESDDYLKEREETFSDKLIGTCATYNETSHISIDDSSKSTAEDEDEHLQSIESPTKSNETETKLSVDNEATFESLYDYRLYRITDTKSVSDDSIEQSHMKGCRRQLFLGVNDSEDDSSDFEVNRSMASTFILDIDTRKDNVIRNDTNIDSDLSVSITKEKQLTKSTTESDVTFSDKLIGTCATYNETSHISIDDSSKSTAEDEDEHLQSIESPTKSNETETQLSEGIEVNDNKQIGNDKRMNLTNEATFESLDDYRLYTITEEEAEIIDTKSVSDDSIEQSHRISTTIAEVHESPVRGSVQFNNGSPVLIPRVRQFGRTVFGSGIVSRLSGQSINILETSDEKNNRVPTRIADLEPIAHGEKSIEEMREARGSGGGNVSWHGEIDQTSPTLAFEAKISADKLEDVSSNYNEIHASIEEEIVTSVEEYNIQNNDFWSVSPVQVNLEDLPKDNSRSNKRKSDSSDDAPSSKRKLKDNSRSNKRKSDSSDDAPSSNRKLKDNSRSNKRKSDSSDDAPSSKRKLKDNSRSNKRKSDSSDDAPSSKRKKDVSTQTSSDEKLQGENVRRELFVGSKDVSTQTSSDEKLQGDNVRKELFVGSPLVFKLCRCPDHVCP